jgi:hypothetical protein
MKKKKVRKKKCYDCKHKGGWYPWAWLCNKVDGAEPNNKKNKRR